MEGKKMDISSVGGSALTPEVQAQYAVKCILASRQTDYVTGALIQDAAEISDEAMQRYMAEKAAE